MGGFKLKTIHVIIIGSIACVAIVVGLYFLVIKKTTEQITALTAEYQKNEQVWNEKPKVEGDLRAAEQRYRIAQAKYDKYLREKMPPISFEKREEGMIALWKEQAEVLGPLLQKWPNKTKGIILRTGITVPDPPISPGSVETRLIKLDIGEIEVAGDFRDILAHIRSWNKFGRLVQIGPLSLSMSEQGMVGKYHLVVYIFPRGEAGTPVPMAGTGTAAASTAAPGGMPPDMGMPAGAQGT